MDYAFKARSTGWPETQPRMDLIMPESRRESDKPSTRRRVKTSLAAVSVQVQVRVRLFCRRLVDVETHQFAAGLAHPARLKGLRAARAFDNHALGGAGHRLRE